MAKPGSPSLAQTEPAKLTEGDYWTWTCGICHLCCQGGRGGLEAHMATVHPGRRA